MQRLEEGKLITLFLVLIPMLVMFSILIAYPAALMSELFGYSRFLTGFFTLLITIAIMRCIE